jgi:hypothetical protein
MKFLNYIFIITALNCSAQAKKQDFKVCRTLLNDYIEKTSSIDKLQPGQTIFMDVSYKVVSSEAEGPVLTNTKYVMNEDICFYENEKINVYMDKKDFFVVVHNNHYILRNDPVSNDSVTRTVYGATFKLRDSLLKTGALVGCYEEGNKTMISFMADPKLRAKTKVETLTYTFEGKEMKEINIKYLYDHHISRVEVTYNKLDLHYPKISNNSARSFVLENNGKLKSKYKGYSYVDNKLNN